MIGRTNCVSSQEYASIEVTAPTGSTVTCTTPGGVVMTATEVSGHWLFEKLKSLGTYTVSATLGTKSLSKSALIDSYDLFQIEIDYNIYLYNQGNECTSLTGGWSSSGYAYDTSSVSVEQFVKNTNSIQLSASSGYYAFKSIGVQTPINLTGYTKLCISANVTNVAGYGLRQLATPTKTLNWNYHMGDINTVGQQVWEKDISSISGSWYWWFGCKTDYYVNGTIDKIWLE